MEDVDIAIAGGGPAGLAAANAIRAAFGDSVNCKV
jgi:2-polyprenyl-6-methoxyphenol hydroxylase-like FAD-dependent oxidoreductase